jgi:hypothetical protein
MKSDDPRAELVRLLELDYERTNKFIEGVLATSVTIRGWAITISLALVGVGFDRHLWEAGLLAIFVLTTFAMLDAYHSWLYSQALTHSRSIERTLSLYYTSLGRGRIDEAAVEDFEVALEAHAFGLTSNLARFNFRSALRIRSLFVPTVLYLVLLGAAALSIILIRFVEAAPAAK